MKDEERRGRPGTRLSGDGYFGGRQISATVIDHRYIKEVDGYLMSFMLLLSKSSLPSPSC
jgi:hypothetical protein